MICEILEVEIKIQCQDIELNEFFLQTLCLGCLLVLLGFFVLKLT